MMIDSESFWNKFPDNIGKKVNIQCKSLEDLQDFVNETKAHYILWDVKDPITAHACSLTTKVFMIEQCNDVVFTSEYNPTIHHDVFIWRAHNKVDQEYVDSIKNKLGNIINNKGDEESMPVTNKCKDKEINTVSVRWFDGYLEKFEATEVRFGGYILWMRLSNGSERIVPLTQVRWFSQSIESHEKS